MKVKDIIEHIHGIAPFDAAEKWDNSGLQVGHPELDVKKVIIALDVSRELVEMAATESADMIITHHPLLITPSKTVDFSDVFGTIVRVCARHDISIVSAHTNLDKAQDGLNDYFAARLGITVKQNSLTFQELDNVGRPLPGIGRIGSLDSPLELIQFADRIKTCLNVRRLRVTGNLSQFVQNVAVCTGSGGSLVDDFLKSGADVFVTGDVKYHEARNAEQYSKAIIDVGHFASEHIAIDLLFELLSPALSKDGIDLIKYKKEKDPFTIV